HPCRQGPRATGRTHLSRQPRLKAEAQTHSGPAARGARVDAHWGRPHMVNGAGTVAPPWKRPHTTHGQPVENSWLTDGVRRDCAENSWLTDGVRRDCAASLA